MSVTTLALGFNSTIELDIPANDGTFSTPVTIGGFTSGSLALARTNPDSTNIDTGGYQGREYGIKGATINAEMLDDSDITLGDAAQEELLNDYNTGTKRWMRVKPRVGTDYPEYDARYVIDSVNYTIEQGGIVRFSLAASSDGTITKADQ